MTTLQPASARNKAKVGDLRRFIPKLDRIDLLLAALSVLLIFTPLTIALFHFVYIVLAWGAFRWKFESFVGHATVWVPISSVCLFVAAQFGNVSSDEFIEIPLLATLLFVVGLLARARNALDERNRSLNIELDKRIQELVKTKSELQQSLDQFNSNTRLRAEFMTATGHELRAPLNAIIGYSEVLAEVADEQKFSASIRRDLDRIHNAGIDLLGFLNNILDLSRLQAGTVEVFVESFDFPGLLNSVVDSLRPLAEKNANTLIIECPENFGPVTADLNKTRIIMRNLLHNALKFTSKGTVTITVKRTMYHALEHLELAVTDTGIGMTNEQMGNLFNEFRPADTAVLRKYGGVGLGLVISRNFCQLMGGNITVQSVFGQGSTFTMKMPIVVEGRMVKPATPPRWRTMPLGTSTSTRLLAIDDDAVVSDLVTTILSKEGFQVYTAANGQIGLKMAKELKPDVITLDVFMPEMDGWAVLVALKQDNELADIPVVMLTTVGDNRNKGYSLGASGYVDKPVNRERLLEALKPFRRTAIANNTTTR